MIASGSRISRRVVALLAPLSLIPIGSVDASLAAAPAASRAGYNLAFADADAHHVIDAVFGDILHLNYSVDPKVTGTITLRTASPVDRDDAIAVLEKALEPIGAVIVGAAAVIACLPRKARVPPF